MTTVTEKGTNIVETDSHSLTPVTESFDADKSPSSQEPPKKTGKKRKEVPVEKVNRVDDEKEVESTETKTPKKKQPVEQHQANGNGKEVVPEEEEEGDEEPQPEKKAPSKKSSSKSAGKAAAKGAATVGKDAVKGAEGEKKQRKHHFQTIDHRLERRVAVTKEVLKGINPKLILGKGVGNFLDHLQRNIRNQIIETCWKQNVSSTMKTVSLRRIKFAVATLLPTILAKSVLKEIRDCVNALKVLKQTEKDPNAKKESLSSRIKMDFPVTREKRSIAGRTQMRVADTATVAMAATLETLTWNILYWINYIIKRECIDQFAAGDDAATAKKRQDKKRTIMPRHLNHVIKSHVGWKMFLQNVPFVGSVPVDLPYRHKETVVVKPKRRRTAAKPEEKGGKSAKKSGGKKTSTKKRSTKRRSKKGKGGGALSSPIEDIDDEFLEAVNAVDNSNLSTAGDDADVEDVAEDDAGVEMELEVEPKEGAYENEPEEKEDEEEEEEEVSGPPPQKVAKKSILKKKADVSEVAQADGGDDGGDNTDDDDVRAARKNTSSSKVSKNVEKEADTDAGTDKVSGATSDSSSSASSSSGPAENSMEDEAVSPPASASSS